MKFKMSLLLCIFFTILLKPSTSLQLDVHPSFTSLPRKLNAMYKVTTKSGNKFESHMKAKEDFLGELQKKEVKMVQITGEKWRKWEKSHEEQSDLFTMDYRRVRRRRPIHNKSLHP
ncbi:unnamed protein product [Amaranthus hypochondriacus]